jgi:hypothetical protein
MKARTSLFIGSAHSVIVGGYHFLLPKLWGWKAATSELVDSIEWALYALNFLFSFQLCAGGIMAIWLLIKKKEQDQFPKIFFYYLTLFWLVNFAYQMINPFPVPEQYKVVATLLPSLALATFLLFAIPLIRNINSITTTHENV